MLDLLIVAQYTDLPSANRKGRFNYISEKMAENNNINVELVSTDFGHIEKAHLSYNASFDSKYKYTMIHEPGYKRNISVKRILSHKKLARNLKSYLDAREKPDLIYCAVPSLDFAKVASDYAKKNNIPFYIDVQDLWPEAFKMVVRIPVVSNIAFFPMKILANKIYRNADQVIGVSNTYCERAMKVNKKCKKALSVYLGNNVNHFVLENRVRSNDEVILAYAGTLGHSYDLTCVFEAIKILQDQNVSNLKFLIMGDGPLREKFETYVEENGVKNVEFTGRLSYEELAVNLINSDIAINPITHGSAGSIINKVGDYALAGLPVINTQECLEYWNLVESENIGINCRNGDANEMAQAILELINNSEKRKEMGKNNRKLGERRFNRDSAYIDIFESILKGINQ